MIRISADSELEELLMNRCFELGSCGIDSSGNALISYFPPSIDTKALLKELRVYAESITEGCKSAKIPEFALSRITDENWTENWKAHFKPLAIGKKLYIVPPWEEQNTLPGRETIVIKPGIAFGIGNHESTALALELLENYIEPGVTLFDIGTGTGILAIAAARLGAGRVFAVDCDPEATDAARENIQRNGVNAVVSTVLGSFPGDSVSSRAPEASFDVLTANLTRTLIIQYKTQFFRLLRPGKIFIASGLELRDAASVLDSYACQPCSAERRLTRNNWTAIAFRKNV